jgi:hypothetical protein
LDLRSFHTSLEAREHFRELSTAISEVGLAPVFGQARNSVSEKLRMVGLTAPAPFAGSGDVEVLAQAEGDGAIVMRLVASAGSDSPESAYGADIRVVSASAATQLEELLREKVQTLDRHSWAEARLIERLGASLSESTADGATLADEEARQRIRELYDDRLREALSRLLGTARGARAREAMEWLRPFADDAETRHVLFGNPAIFAQRYAVSCRTCETAPYIAFAERGRAEAIIEELGRTCANCGEQTLEVAEFYRIAEEFASAIQRGLWLRSLVGDAVAGRTDAFWVSRKIGRIEYDVVAVHADDVFLFACKDGPLSAADIYTASRAAEQLDVKSVILVTTAEVPRKAQDAVSALSTGLRTYHVISERTAEAIKAAVQRALDDSAWKVLDRSIAEEPAMATFIRRNGGAPVARPTP